MNYSKEFKDAVDFSEKNQLFLGFGNQNAKILIIGKEHYHDTKSEVDTPEYYKELLTSRESDNKENIRAWQENISTNFKPTWAKQESFCNSSNPQTAWWNQKNKQDRRLKGGDFNKGTSNTYLHYQKIYQNVFHNGEKLDNIDFQREFFLSEMNDLPSKESYNLPKLNELRSNFIAKRKELFNLPYFKNFPVIILASGHYSRDYDFNIEDVFDVKFIGETKTIGKSWYNLHFSSDNKRILIHTRQLSTSVSNDLTLSISNEIKKFLSK